MDDDFIVKSLWGIVIILFISSVHAGYVRGAPKEAREVPFPCNPCISVLHNKETLYTHQRSVISIELPDILYDESSLQIQPQDAVIPLASPAEEDPFHWTRAYALLAPGTVSVSAAPKKPTNPPFAVKIIVQAR